MLKEFDCQQIQAFAELGRVFQSFRLVDFVEPITDEDILSDLQEILEGQAGRINRIYDVSLDGDTFSGKAEKRISLGKVEAYEFTISSIRIYFKPITTADLSEYLDSDQGWGEVIEYAAMVRGKGKRAGMDLKCKPENYQCGGKCQSRERGCPSDPTAAQRAKIEGAVEKASGRKQSKKVEASGSTVKTSFNQEGLDKTRAMMVSVHGEKLINDAESNVNRILNDENTGVFMRVPSPELMAKILGDRFKSYFEVNDDKESWYAGERIKAEQNVMGVPATAEPSERPLYGYFGSRNFDGASNDEVSKYGNIAVEFKPTVKERATVTGADSMESGYSSPVSNSSLASHLNGLWVEGGDEYNQKVIAADSSKAALERLREAEDIDDLVTKNKTGYFEAQIYGQLTPADIKAIHFRSDGDPITPEVAKLAKDNGIAVYLDGVEQ